jgi:cell division protein FtsB
MWLNFYEPMPFSRGLRKEVLYICISGAIALLIFYLLHPFGLSNLGLLGYGVVSVASAIMYVALTHLLYKFYWGHRNWTVGLEILHSLFFLLFVGGGIMTYGYLAHISDATLTNILIYLLYTVLLGFMPVTIRAMLVKNWRLKKDLSEAKKINELLSNRKHALDEKIIEFRNKSSDDILKLSNYDLLFVEATENYVTVVWESNHTIKKQMIRMTMKEAIKQMSDPSIVFSHRSFIINLRKVQKVSSHAGISTITLKDTDISIPLSSTYKKEIKRKLNEIL